MKSNLNTYYNNPLVKYILNNEVDKNYLIYAGGGFGKTTAMKCLWFVLLDKAYKGEKIVPIYIDVKTLNSNGVNPLFEYIYNRYCGIDSDYGKFCDIFFENKTSSFAKNYIFWLLVDGYNEVTGDLSYKLQNDIRKLSMCSNVKMIVSSRTDENSASFTDFKKVILDSLSDNQIAEYLKNNFNREDIEPNRINPNLIEILRVPMFLETFVKTYKDNLDYPHLFDTSIIRKADILDRYTEKILEDLKEQELSTEIIKKEFAIKYYLPALAFYFIQKETLSISDAEYLKLSFEDGSKWDTYFKLYLNSSERAGYKYAFVDGKDEWISIFKNQFALMEKSEENHAFKHHIWREFFAAKHIVNAINRGVLTDLEISIDENVRHFVGELLKKDGKCECDYETKIDLNSDSSPLEDFMQKYSQELSPLAVSNCVEIMKTSRNNKITADYSNLDLTQASFLNCDLVNSKFKKSKVTLENFQNETYYNTTVRLIDAAEKQDLVITCGYDNEILFWKIIDGEMKVITSFHMTDMEHNPSQLLISSNGNFFATMDDEWGGTLKIWNSNNFECKEISFEDEKRSMAGFSSNEKYLVVVQEDGSAWNINFIGTRDGENKKIIKTNGYYECYSFIPGTMDFVFIEIVNEISILKIIDIEDNFKLKHQSEIIIDGKAKMTCSCDGFVYIMDFSNIHKISITPFEYRKIEHKFDFVGLIEYCDICVINEVIVLQGGGRFIYLFDTFDNKCKVDIIDVYDYYIQKCDSKKKINWIESCVVTSQNKLITTHYSCIVIWDIESKKTLFVEEKNECNSLMGFNKNTDLALAHAYNDIRIWDIKKQQLFIPMFNSGHVYCEGAFFVDDSQFILVYSYSIYLYSFFEQKIIGCFSLASPDMILHVLACFSNAENIKLLVKETEGRYCYIFDKKFNLIKKTPINLLSDMSYDEECIANFDEDGKSCWFLYKNYKYDKCFKRFDLQSHSEVPVHFSKEHVLDKLRKWDLLDMNQYDYWHDGLFDIKFAISKTGNWLVDITDDYPIIFNKENGMKKKIECEIDGMIQGSILDASFSGNENYVIVGYESGVYVWETKTGKLICWLDANINCNIWRCDFKECDCIEEENEFYRIAYMNGAFVPLEFIPEPLDLGD